MDNRFVETGEATQEALREAAVALVCRRALPGTVLAPHEYKRYTCSECDEDLPTFRMQKGLTICTTCLSEKELVERRRKA